MTDEQKLQVDRIPEGEVVGRNTGAENREASDEPATPAQKSYISTMAVEVKEPIPFELTKAEASEKINELQQMTGRDTSSDRP